MLSMEELLEEVIEPMCGNCRHWNGSGWSGEGLCSRQGIMMDAELTGPGGCKVYTVAKNGCDEFEPHEAAIAEAKAAIKAANEIRETERDMLREDGRLLFP